MLLCSLLPNTDDIFSPYPSSRFTIDANCRSAASMWENLGCVVRKKSDALCYI